MLSPGTKERREAHKINQFLYLRKGWREKKMVRRFASTKKLAYWFSGFAIVAGFILAPLLYALVFVASIFILKMLSEKKLYAKFEDDVERILSSFRKHSDA